MLRELGKEQDQILRSLLMTHYAPSQPKIIGAVENKAGAATFAIALKDGQYITFVEIVKPTVPVTVEKFAEEWIHEKINGALGEAVKTSLKKRGRLNYQAFELDTRVDNETKIRRVAPFGHIEFTAVLPHTQFNFEYYSHELKSLTDDVTGTEDFKKAFSKISQLSESLKNTLIEANKKQELFVKLNDCYQILDKRQAQTKGQYEKECADNYDALLIRCNELNAEAKVATQFKEVRDKLKSIQADLNEKTLKREKRNELYDLIHQCYAEMDKRRDDEQEEYEKTTMANFETVFQKTEAARENCKATMDVHSSREELKKLQADCWELKLKREHRAALHNTFNELFELLNQRYEELKFQLETESNTNKDQLALKVEEMEKFVNSSTDLKATREQLKAMQKELNDMKLTPSHRQELWQLIDKAFKVLNAKMEEAISGERKISDEHYAAFKPKLEATVEELKDTVNFKEAREKLITLQKEFKDLKIFHKQRQELWSMMDNTFKTLNERADKHFAQKRNEREQHNRDWHRRMDDKLVRMDYASKAMQQENLDAQGYLGKLQDWLSTVRDNAATKEFRQTILDKIKGVEDQIAERKARIDDIKKNKKEIHEKLREEETKKEEKKKKEEAPAQEQTIVAKEESA